MKHTTTEDDVLEYIYDSINAMVELTNMSTDEAIETFRCYLDALMSEVEIEMYDNR